MSGSRKGARGTPQLTVVAGGALLVLVTGAGLFASRTLAQAPGPARPAADPAMPSPDEPGDAASFYAKAIAAARDAAKRAPQDPVAARTLIRVLAEKGLIDDAIAEVERFRRATPRSPELLNTLGDLLSRQGRLDDAERAYADAVTAHASDALAADVSRGLLAATRRAASGRGTAGDASFERAVAAYNDGRARTASDLIAVGRACRALGASHSDAFKDALKAFDEATESPSNETEDLRTDARILLGELFLEKFNGPDARASFEAALAVRPFHPRALLGLARALDFEGERGVPDLLKRALDTDPRHPEVLAYRSSLSLALENRDDAHDEAIRALDANPSSPEGLAALAAARFIGGDAPGFEAAAKRAADLYPASGALFVEVADAAVRNRLYGEALALADRALRIEPKSAPALAMRGQNLLRLGRIDEGRSALERSFEGDPYNVWVKNTLDLLDTFKNFKTTRIGRLELFLHAEEHDVLAPLAEALAEEALSKLSERYQWTPPGPIRIEAFKSHADFSVRTIGLAGLGALGVCFGPVVVIDSPSARDLGTFNWGSTLWHELAHTITMGASANWVPRWLTEGISVHEERRARPGWGDDLSLEFLLAHQADQLLPLGELNKGFIRPTRPEQVALSYYQASLVVDHIESRYGIEGIRKLLRAFRDHREMENAFKEALGGTVEEVDRDFKAGIKARLETTLATIRAPRPAARGQRSEPPSRADFEKRIASDANDFVAHASLGQIYLRERREDDALRSLQRARTLWPGSAGDESPYPAIAQILEGRKDLPGAIAALRAYTALNESDWKARQKLLALLEASGDQAAALDLLTGALFISPFDPKSHEKRASLGAALGRRPDVLAARRALVALGPLDPAGAYYELALAELDSGDRDAARRAVLRALEAAPRYARAQELLLRIHRLETKP